MLLPPVDSVDSVRFCSPIESSPREANDLRRHMVYITMAQSSERCGNQAIDSCPYIAATEYHYPQGDLQGLEEHSLKSKHAWCWLKTTCSSHLLLRGTNTVPSIERNTFLLASSANNRLHSVAMM